MSQKEKGRNSGISKVEELLDKQKKGK